MALMPKEDFINNVVELTKSVDSILLFGLDGRSLFVYSNPYYSSEVFFTSASAVLLNAAYTACAKWLLEFNEYWSKELADDAKAEAAAERAHARAYEDSGWLAAEEQDYRERFISRLDPQSGFYGDF